MIPELLNKPGLGRRSYSVPEGTTPNSARGSSLTGAQALARSLQAPNLEVAYDALSGNQVAAPNANAAANAHGTADANTAEISGPAGAPEGDEGSWPTEGAEAAAIADARERGESVAISNALHKAEDETTKKTLPPLHQVIPKISQEVQDALEDIFRAKWTRVMRVKKRDLSNP